ncbi:MAG: L-threonylcarbamoyladenylate synthase [Thermoplasmata archaeon]
MPSPLDAAAAALRHGRLVVYPTDTLWGLAARAPDPRAVALLFEAKRRPPGLPVSLAVSSLEEIEPWTELPETVRSFLRRELPGPLTVLLPPSGAARRRLPPGLLGPGGALAVRIPDHPVARELARRAGPITATSANRHGEPEAASLGEVRRALGRRVAVYLNGAPRPSLVPSRIVDLTGPVPSDVARE